ncbi:MAG: aminotransferase class V-fold PLP-dependent enzyme [Pseudomonadota bacterium]|nr:aminotransferase class V-fold PLP-dependent enzyme [Pseudomonadota bacterium]
MSDVQALIEQEFNLQDDLIHLNHAAVGPWPGRTQQAVEAFARENHRLGSLHYPHWVEVETRLRERGARLINAAADDIALVKNTSEALSMVAWGLDWQPGETVVISDEEFPSNRIVWESLQSRGVKVHQVNLHGHESPEQALIGAIDSTTRLLAISSVQYASGLRVNLVKLGEHCRQHNILFCVDAIQSLGALQFDVQACGADFVMADGHKWMLGPEGLALFYSRPQAREQLQLFEYGWHMVEQMGDFDNRQWEPAHNARRFECGSPNMLCSHALEASLSLIEEIGMSTIEQQVLENSRRLFDAIDQFPNLELITDTQPGRYAGIVVFRHKQIPVEQLYPWLMEQRVLCAQRGGGIRFSPHFYTPWPKIEQGLQLANTGPQ